MLRYEDILKLLGDDNVSEIGSLKSDNETLRFPLKNLNTCWTILITKVWI